MKAVHYRSKCSEDLCAVNGPIKCRQFSSTLHLIDGKQRKNGAKHGKNGEAPGKEENGANSRIIGTKCTNTCPVVNSKFGVGLSIATNSVCVHWNKWAKNETQILKCPKC